MKPPGAPSRPAPAPRPSAGSAPAETINPAAVQAMGEVGIDITDQTPELLEYATAESSDVIVTMGCGDACPVFPGKRVDAVRPIRDEIRGRVEKLLTDLNLATRPRHTPQRPPA
ncbi:hypothetical protein [Micromonospora saelicesensis]|nr:hypothetical protein [Micromonospora saelicesensis]